MCLVFTVAFGAIIVCSNIEFKQNHPYLAFSLLLVRIRTLILVTWSCAIRTCTKNIHFTSFLTSHNCHGYL